jgi:hypothetical protein
MYKLFLFCLSLLLLLSSCIELIDDLTIHNDGSGTFKYTMNLSSSKTKVNSILALDSINGKKVLSKAEIKSKINLFAGHLKTQAGISNVSVSINDLELIVKFSCDFTSVSTLQNGLKNALVAINNIKNTEDLNQNWLSYDGEVLKRNIPIFSITLSDHIKEMDIDLLKTGSYASINRFDRPIVKVEKGGAKINPSRTACMLKVNAYDLHKNYSLIDNCIYLSPKKNK